MFDKINKILAQAIEEMKLIEVEEFDTNDSAAMWSLVICWMKIAEIQEIVTEKIKEWMNK